MRMVHKEVHVKDLDSHAVKALLVSRALLVKIKRDLENQIRGLAGHHCATPEAPIAFAAVIKDCRASTLHENIVRLGFELIGPIRAAFPSPEPRRPD